MSKKESGLLLISVGLFLSGGAPTASIAGGRSVQKEIPIAKIWIKKNDGAISCETSKAESLEASQKALEKAGVKVFQSKKQSDGLVRAMVCGMPQGNQNAHEVRAEDLEKAKALGFERSFERN